MRPFGAKLLHVLTFEGQSDESLGSLLHVIATSCISGRYGIRLLYGSLGKSLRLRDPGSDHLVTYVDFKQVVVLGSLLLRSVLVTSTRNFLSLVLALDADCLERGLP